MWAGKICEKTRRNHVRPEPKSVLIILSLILFVIILASNFEGADAGRRGGGGSWGRGSRYIFKTYLIWMPIRLMRKYHFTSPRTVFWSIYFTISVEEKEVVEAACLVGGLGEARRKLLTEIHNPAIQNKNTDLRLIQGN